LEIVVKRSINPGDKIRIQTPPSRWERSIYVIAPEEEASVAMKIMNEKGMAIELCSERSER
jgi:hypothetical protein